ncbi:hypothetical protein [Streptomyces sp.]|uniref:hypothetical protein n=1 Tax=Streptomyces sp. TaxID=1931 RepID=UPI002F942415
MQDTILSEHIGTESAFTELASQWDVPTVAGLQHQGDVSVVPASMVADFRLPTRAVPRVGVAVVRGESGGNTHLLLAEGEVRFDSREASATDLTLGSLSVAEGATAFLDHPEHGNTGIAPGEYVLRRKREQADELRMVQD